MLRRVFFTLTSSWGAHALGAWTTCSLCQTFHHTGHTGIQNFLGSGCFLRDSPQHAYPCTQVALEHSLVFSFSKPAGVFIHVRFNSSFTFQPAPVLHSIIVHLQCSQLLHEISTASKKGDLKNLEERDINHNRTRIREGFQE